MEESGRPFAAAEPTPNWKAFVIQSRAQVPDPPRLPTTVTLWRKEKSMSPLKGEIDVAA
jgi:hypothetical protein